MSRIGCYKFDKLERTIPHKGVLYTFMTEAEAIDVINTKVRKICKAKGKIWAAINTDAPVKLIFGLVKIRYTYYYS